MKKKIVIVQNKLPEYRIGIYNYLSRFYDLTIVHSGVEKKMEQRFNEILLKSIKIGPFYFQKGVSKVLDELKADCVILMFDLWWLSNILAVFKRKERTVLWGHRYSKNNIANKIKNQLMKKADAHILYSCCDVKEIIESGISRKKIFIAHNTMDIENHSFNDFSKKTSLLFVGRAQERKKVNLLLEAFNEIKNEIPPHIRIDIIGEGEENNKLQILARKLKIDNRVYFHGKIIDKDLLKVYFHNAIAYVSPGPVGLGVLHSLGYGVPVVTLKEGKHGPEFSNLKHRKNSLVCSDFSQLKIELSVLCNDISKAKSLGYKGYLHFTQKRSIEVMGKGFIDAIEQI